MRKGRRSKMKNAENTMMHLSASTVTRNSHLKPKTNAVSWINIKTPAHQCGSPPKAPEGVWGPK